MKTIVVNNPAARSSGALTILLEFLDKISTLKCERQFICFVSLEELKKYESEKIKIIVVGKQGVKERILWDNYKLKKYLKDKEIKPDLFLSIQNTGVNLKQEIPQIIYYHQPLSIVDLKWSFFKKSERQYWIYRNIYPIFIKQYLKRVKKVIVQTEWVKDAFNIKFNYSKKNIILLKPEIKKINTNLIKDTPKNKFRIFYPATPLVYKNHKIVIEALGALKKEKGIENMECIFTFDKNENLELDALIKNYKLEENVRLIGKIPYKKVLEYYKNSDMLVFPSYLETLGLPLLEAQLFELNILVSDYPYSREIIGEYKKVEFIKSFDKEGWKEKIWEKYFSLETL
ncbi:glycosyltransferase [Cetobacterium sp.]|uniref:glycosyltransferase n=1 Tax=Cetobacterium sp. TaxID=2071632 RepID=UPI003F3719AD